MSDMSDPKDILRVLMELRSETEWVEFKEESVDFEHIGKYVSALSNEANLNGKLNGWLIFGVTDHYPRIIVGSRYCETPPGLDKLKRNISQHTNHGFTFEAIREIITSEGRVVMFQIPPATRGIPTEWKSRCYGRVHDSLEPLTLGEIQRIRDQGATLDWSAQICERATINDLEPEAIAVARREFGKKNPRLSKDSEAWSEVEFLNRSGLCVEGNITNAAILLLGKPESEHLISPAVAQITWVLKDESGTDKDYAHFGLPFLLSVDMVFKKIRNLTYRHISDETLFPLEISQYDTWVIREALHNCIAHQDYSQASRVSIVETPDSLLFTNRGVFIPGSVESVLTSESPPDKYRNPFLAKTMVNLNMIDTIGSGIRRMFQHQRTRNFPLPDYVIEDGRVSVSIPGKVIDPKYTRMLIRRKDLDLFDVIALDKVQKGREISEEEFRLIKAKKLIEGRRPNIYVSEYIAAATDTRAEYIKKRSFDRRYFSDIIVSYLKKYHEIDRKEIDKLLMDKVSDALDDDHKHLYIKNLLQEMRKKGLITTTGGRTRRAKWILKQKPPKEKG